MVYNYLTDPAKMRFMDSPFTIELWKLPGGELQAFKYYTLTYNPSIGGTVAIFRVYPKKQSHGKAI